MIKSRKVISEPGAAIRVTQLELTDAGRKALSIPVGSLDNCRHVDRIRREQSRTTWKILSAMWRRVRRVKR